MATATVRLTLHDVLEQPLNDPEVLIEFFGTTNSKHFRVSVPLRGQQIVNVTLNDAGMDIFRVVIVPSNYRIVQFFLRIADGSTASRKPIVFPVNPDRVTDIKAPDFDGLPATLKSFLGNASVSLQPASKPLQGEALYSQLTPLLKAALLNLYTKATATILGDGETVFQKLGPMIMIHQDRLFAKTTAALFEETMQDPFFHQVSFSLHETVPPYHLFDSYKTRDSHGNLQLTFSRNGETGNDYLADMDIDEAQGIGHLFEVLQNALTSTLTNPYNVREILITDQNLIPPYDFKFAQSGVAMAASAAASGGAERG